MHGSFAALGPGAAKPVDTALALDELAVRAAHASIVLIGEASHGTEDFYAMRAALTRRLVADHGFRAVTLEADWPDTFRAHRFVTGRSDEKDARAALADFRRFPVMWRSPISTASIPRRLRAPARVTGASNISATTRKAMRSRSRRASNRARTRRLRNSSTFDVATALRGASVQRAIGVIYRPDTERWSHYFEARLPEQFDALIHLDNTKALTPLDRTSGWDEGEPPETYPTGM